MKKLLVFLSFLLFSVSVFAQDTIATKIDAIVHRRTSTDTITPEKLNSVLKSLNYQAITINANSAKNTVVTIGSTLFSTGNTPYAGQFVKENGSSTITCFIDKDGNRLPVNVQPDLTGYATTTQLASKADASSLSNYATTTQLASKADNSALSNYATTTQLSSKADNSTLSNYATTTQLSSKADASSLSNYATTTQLSSKADASSLSNYATTTQLASKADNSALSNYATTTQLGSKADNSALSNYATTTQLGSKADNSALSNYATTTQLATKADAGAFVQVDNSNVYYVDKLYTGSLNGTSFNSQLGNAKRGSRFYPFPDIYSARNRAATDLNNGVVSTGLIIVAPGNSFNITDYPNAINTKEFGLTETVTTSPNSASLAYNNLSYQLYGSKLDFGNFSFIYATSPISFKMEGGTLVHGNDDWAFQILNKASKIKIYADTILNPSNTQIFISSIAVIDFKADVMKFKITPECDFGNSDSTNRQEIKFQVNQLDGGLAYNNNDYAYKSNDWSPLLNLYYCNNKTIYSSFGNYRNHSTYGSVLAQFGNYRDQTVITNSVVNLNVDNIENTIDSIFTSNPFPVALRVQRSKKSSINVNIKKGIFSNGLLDITNLQGSTPVQFDSSSFNLYCGDCKIDVTQTTNPSVPFFFNVPNLTSSKVKIEGDYTSNLKNPMMIVTSGIIEIKGTFRQLAANQPVLNIATGATVICNNCNLIAPSGVTNSVIGGGKLICVNGYSNVAVASTITTTGSMSILSDLTGH